MEGISVLSVVTMTLGLVTSQGPVQPTDMIPVEGESVYVAVHGEDRPQCGQSADTPCQSLQQALLEADHGDTIYIDAQHTENVPFELCPTDPVSISKSISIVGYNGVPRVGCNYDSNRLFMLNITANDSELEVRFTDVVLISMLFTVHNAHVTFDSCTLEDSHWLSLTTTPFVGMSLLNSEWRGALFNCTPECKSKGKISCGGEVLDINYADSVVYHTELKMTATKHGNISIDRCIFDNHKDMKPMHGGVHIYLTLSPTDNPTIIKVTDSIFRNQVFYSPVDSIVNLYLAALFIRSRAGNTGTHTDIAVIVDNCQFINNERGLTFIGPFTYMNISNSRFEDNIAMHAGAAILYLSDKTSPSYVTNCTFLRNAAGSFRTELIADYADSFQVSGDEVRILSDCCKGTMDFVGKGGAIRLQRGNLSLIDCTFDSNTARVFGGAIVVDTDNQLSVSGTDFFTSPDDVHAIQGDIIYSNGVVSIDSARLYARSAEDHVELVYHSGSHWSMSVFAVTVQCPQGYRLRVANTSAYGVRTNGIRRSYKLDKLSYFCELCAKHEYSLDYGYLDYNLTHNSFSYHTLLINGETPQATYSGTYDYKDVKCMHCPYGGNCERGITAVANFWGYVHGDEIRFQRCAEGYCCSSTDCENYNTCAKFRTGRLCGMCIPGYSEALFSSNCVPNEECDASYLLPLAILCGFLYALFLLFQKDVRDFLSGFKSMSPSELQCHRCRKSQTYGITNNEIPSVPHCASTELESLHLETEETDADQEIMKTRNDSQKPEHGMNETGDADEAAPEADKGAVFLIILFYFYQDAQLLHVESVFTSAENQLRARIQGFLSGLFRVELFQFMDQFCFVPNMSAPTKQVVKVVLVYHVLLIFGLIFLVYKCMSKLKRSRNPQRETSKPFLSKIATGVVLYVLFTHQILAITSLKLLNCVPVENDRVLFIQGNVVCYEYWQYFVIAYAVFCILPFFLVMLIGPGLLKDGISLLQFFGACLVPLPFLIYWVWRSLKGTRPSNPPKISDEAQAVCGILQGPFRDLDGKLFGPLCSAGIIIGRRLLLVLLFTFVNDALIRILCMLLVCFVALLYHLLRLPYKETRGNLAGTASIAFLLFIGAINLMRAGFEAAEYVPQGPNEILMLAIEELENVLMIYLPAVVIGLIILALTVKIVLLILKRIINGPNAVSDSPRTAVAAP